MLSVIEVDVYTVALPGEPGNEATACIIAVKGG